MYDFQTVNNRRNSNSVKWDVQKQELPMNLADMDFQTAPEIITALQEKVATGIFGYENVPLEYYQAVKLWYQQVHQCTLQTEWMLFATGVVPAISSIVRRMSHAGDNIVVQPPVYNIFYHSIENNGRHTLTNDLLYQDGSYQINWEQLEQQLAQPLTTMMLLCNPQNPSGQIWTKSQLSKLSRLCKQYQVVLVSDEIHGDLTIGDHDYTPICSLPMDLLQQTVALVSPSKTFNLAALHAATVIVPNQFLRAQINRGLNNDELAEPNLVAIPGSIAAYTKGQKWLSALKQQLQQNYQLVDWYLQQNLPAIKLISGGATYLLWLDCSALKIPADQLATQLQELEGLLLSPGNIYRGNGDHFLRMNIACPPEILQTGLQKLVQGIKLIQK
ncbi:plastocyanin [Bombilactobacillus bombi]|uniref:cysteine-S-conjugate beta-lyase n=1 Tax=Bombilactobacillus bombi TaxID=1303590 RepID=A0A3R6VLC3_9LACO|nr:PatB family C-S lyase [Bombilactobacillus bombi]RHW52020.1 plastocyanin [Bombilactobacillus bombi]